ncbi:vWA domain-containing protein [Polaribacter atrinae]|uniref:vWA domain-containing protein n=1 Tax=Polaribacter atrinae TaxID=1333662 RepID=UPI0024918652|nr:vWA domain-containing protein [Polaribacter atrinae]
MRIKLLPILIFALVSLQSNSQNFKKEKRIYMLDITKSMWGSGNNIDIFEEVKNALYKGIEDIKDTETIVTIIPFQATHTYEILPSWTFKAGNITKLKDIKSKIDSYNVNTVPGGYTDIYSALKKAKENIDKDRINYIFLLTDGEQSKIPSATKKTSKIDFSVVDLEKLLNNWCDFSMNSNSHLFYVMLSKAAINESIVNIINEECNAYNVHGPVNIAFVKPKTKRLKLNLHDEPTDIEINLEANNWGYLKEDTVIELDLEDNSIFELVNNTVKIENKRLVVKLRNKGGLSFLDLQKVSEIESNLLLTLSTTNNLKILNPKINIIVKNHKERILTLELLENE